jgi:SlyX protein
MNNEISLEQLIELQSQLAFQEDLLRDLNEVVIQHQQQIDALQRELLRHRDKLADLLESMPDKGVALSPEAERPPHY